MELTTCISKKLRILADKIWICFFGQLHKILSFSRTGLLCSTHVLFIFMSKSKTPSICLLILLPFFRCNELRWDGNKITDLFHPFCGRKTSACSSIMFTALYFLICFQRGNTFSICFDNFNSINPVFQFETCKKVVKKTANSGCFLDSQKRREQLTHQAKFTFGLLHQVHIKLIHIARLRATSNPKFESPFDGLILHILAHKGVSFELAHMRIDRLMWFCDFDLENVASHDQVKVEVSMDDRDFYSLSLGGSCWSLSAK